MKLFYREYGSGRPVIVLHGLLGSSDNWLPQARMLSDTYRVLVVDQRNHGQSPHHESFTYADLVNDLRVFIEHHQLSGPVLLGHSMGGKVAMQYALNYRSEVDKLIVADIAPRAYDIRHDYIVHGLKAIPIASVKSRQEADEALASYIQDPAVRQFLLKNLMRKPEGGFAWRINLDAIEKNLENISGGLVGAGNCNVPALFIRGEKSDYITDADQQVIRHYFPKASIVTLPAGHWVQAEQPEEFVRVVKAFLNEG
jgi:pimeloyl-ACP methyl ester carboxylesterase